MLFFIFETLVLIYELVILIILEILNIYVWTPDSYNIYLV
jgi:hypothetical protein